MFDRPTSFTLNSLKVNPAKLGRLEATVEMKNEASKSEPATKWLAPEIFGGRRPEKRLERQLRNQGILPYGKYIVPGAGAKLDAHGNMSRGQITKAVSGVNGFSQLGYAANATMSERSTRKGNAKRYFVIKRGNELLIDPAQVTLAPLVQRLLLPESSATEMMWKIGHYRSTRLDYLLSPVGLKAAPGPTETPTDRARPPRTGGALSLMRLIDDVTDASKNQQTGIEQINKNIYNIQTSTTQNANMVEEAFNIATETNNLAKTIVTEANEKKFK